MEQKPGNIMQFAKMEDEVVNPPVVGEAAPQPVAQQAPRPLLSKNSNRVVFNGFQHLINATPKQEVYLPLTQVAVRISPINYGEEAAMAQTFISDSGIQTELAKVIFAHIVEGPERITKSFDSFLDNVVHPDLTALAYGMHIISYGAEIGPFEDAACKKCGKSHKFEKFNIVDFYSEEQFIGGEFAVLDFSKVVDLSDCGLPGVVMTLKIPTIRHVLTMEENSDPVGLAMSRVERYIAKLSLKGEDGTVTEFSDQQSIHNAVKSLPPMARKKLMPIIHKEFQKYGIKFEIPWICNNIVDDNQALGGKKKCDEKNVYTLNIENTFFRQIFDALLVAPGSDANNSETNK